MWHSLLSRRPHALFAPSQTHLACRPEAFSFLSSGMFFRARVLTRRSPLCRRWSLLGSRGGFRRRAGLLCATRRGRCARPARCGARRGQLATAFALGTDRLVCVLPTRFPRRFLRLRPFWCNGSTSHRDLSSWRTASRRVVLDRSRSLSIGLDARVARASRAARRRPRGVGRGGRARSARHDRVARVFAAARGP